MKRSDILRKAFFLSLVIVGTLLIGSCEKEERQKDYTYRCVLCDPSEALGNFFEDNAVQAQTFTVDAADNTELVGQKGTRISFGPNSFGDANGNMISGNIEVTLKEVYSPGEMILEDRMTESNGQILVSGGELFLNVRQNGQDLQLVNNNAVSVSVPTATPDTSMALFTGSQDTGGSFTWAPNPTPVNVCQDPGSGGLAYCFDLYSLFNWINCDYFYNDPRPLTEVEIVVPQGYDRSNTLVYVYVPSINSMIPVKYFLNSSFWIKSGYRVPVGLQVDFIALYADTNGNLGYAYQNNTIVNNHREVLTFTTVTEQDLKSFLASL